MKLCSVGTQSEENIIPVSHLEQTSTGAAEEGMGEG